MGTKIRTVQRLHQVTYHLIGLYGIIIIIKNYEAQIITMGTMYRPQNIFKIQPTQKIKVW